MSKDRIIEYESELSSSQIRLLQGKNISLENVVFLSCTQLKKKLKDTYFSPGEEKQLKKLRKRGREKWLHIRECQYLQDDIIQLEGTAKNLKEEKRILEEEIEKLKIKCFLAAPENAVYQENRILDEICEQDILQCFS
ncbi:hypothetical protein LOD99_13748 [Oopsacas minuta]|uniref:Uncharacterized protein n=1 Tax=Oopsacas minuta TaxID=111878 RepID=A0AAV7KHY8_9METZ|nr:hypothetical protein LOD99_13748 [Oopsacas minuta]